MLSAKGIPACLEVLCIALGRARAQGRAAVALLVENGMKVCSPVVGDHVFNARSEVLYLRLDEQKASRSGPQHIQDRPEAAIGQKPLR